MVVESWVDRLKEFEVHLGVHISKSGPLATSSGQVGPVLSSLVATIAPQLEQFTLVPGGREELSLSKS
jgi:hypothetical protein